jgi:diacylglycerol diphosphate phosphatase / phosphatidate phosphatase
MCLHCLVNFDLSFLKANLLLFTAIFLPLIIVFVHGWRNASRGNRYDWSTGLSGLLTALGVSECCTISLKLYVSRRRPNFYALCGWSTQQLACTAPFKEQAEAQLSFPSGHSSLTFCGMTFLALYFWGQVGMHPFYKGTINSNSGSSHNNKDGTGGRISSIPWSKRCGALFACLGPWSWATTVGASRIVDHWHHPSDVVAGTMLGTVSALVVYHLFYHPVVSPQAGMPLLSFTSRRMLEKLPTVQD